MKGSDAMALKIGEVVERGGVNLQTIRYYEREKLLPEPPRLPSGYRMFPEQTVHRVRFIKRAQELGFSLAEIRDLLSIQIDPKKRSEEHTSELQSQSNLVCRLLLEKKKHVDRRSFVSDCVRM